MDATCTTRKNWVVWDSPTTASAARSDARPRNGGGGFLRIAFGGPVPRYGAPRAGDGQSAHRQSRQPRPRGRASERAADAVVGESQTTQFLRVVQVASIDDQGPLEKLLHPGEVRVAVLQPFGDDRECVGAGERVKPVAGIADAISKMMLRRLHRSRVVRLYPRAGREQLLDEHERRALAHVIGFGLERQAPDRDDPAAQRS